MGLIPSRVNLRYNYQQCCFSRVELVVFSHTHNTLVSHLPLTSFHSTPLPQYYVNFPPLEIFPTLFSSLSLSPKSNPSLQHPTSPYISNLSFQQSAPPSALSTQLSGVRLNTGRQRIKIMCLGHTALFINLS